MASQRIGAEKLERAIRDILNGFEKDVSGAVETATLNTAKEAVKTTKAASPSRTGKYKQGWGYSTERSRLSYKATAHNKRVPGLVHLLQNGHGGPRPARAFPHVQEDDKTAEVFERELEKAVASDLR